MQAFDAGRRQRGGVVDLQRGRHAVLHGGHFGQDRDGDFGRRLAADVQADRPVQARQLGVVEVEQLEPLAPLGVVHARADRADVEGVRLERFHQRQVVQLGIVGQRQHGAAAVQLRFEHQVVGHHVHQRDAGQLPAAAVFFARVAHGDVVIHRGGDLRDEARQLAGADDEQAPARAVHGAQHAAVDVLARRPARRSTGVTAPLRRSSRRATSSWRSEPRQQLADAAGGRQRLDRQFDGAAAGQAEAVRLVGADAVADDLGQRCG